MILIGISLNEALTSLAIGLFGSLLASFIFILLLLKYYRPKLFLSNLICQKLEETPGGTRDKFSFKILNKSIYHGYDIHIELFLMTPINHLGANTNLMMKRLEIRTSSMTSIGRFRKNHHDKDPFALYAYLIHTNEPLNQFLTDPNSFVQLRVTGKHGLTGLSDVVIQSYGNADVIKYNSKFAFGDKLDTMAINLTI
jgi:hypothetical protein